jgi:hypothetical protein
MGAHPTLETARALSDMSFPANGVDPLAGSGVEGLVELGRRPEYSFCTNGKNGLCTAQMQPILDVTMGRGS